MKGKNVAYQQCSRCIMDSNDDPYIKFNDKGVCNHCTQYEYEYNNYVFLGEVGKKKIEQKVAEIKANGKGKPYDCVLGISGGVDSTYLALKAKEYGLRPIGIHCDNGWNSELAVNNIESIVTTLNLDLDTYVIDWEEFRDIQLAYFKANVIDIEAITDIAFRTVLKRTAAKYKVNYYLAGDNIVTESVLPSAWICKDPANLINIHKQFGKVPLKTFPVMKPFELAVSARRSKIEAVEFLNWMDYNKNEVKEVIKKELNWRDYGGKHYESVFTRFYQAFILPQKFGVEKRKAHLSNLICSGQLTKEEALEELKVPAYDPAMYKVDREFVLKKLGFTDAEFDVYIAAPPVDHKVYGMSQSFYESNKVLRIMKPLLKKIIK